MKNIIIMFHFASALILTTTSLNVKAQECKVWNEFKKEAAIARITPETKENAGILYKINIKAARDFMKTYNNISNEKREILEDGYLVSFL